MSTITAAQQTIREAQAAPAEEDYYPLVVEVNPVNLAVRGYLFALLLVLPTWAIAIALVIAVLRGLTP